MYLSPHGTPSVWGQRHGLPHGGLACEGDGGVRVRTEEMSSRLVLAKLPAQHEVRISNRTAAGWAQESTSAARQACSCDGKVSAMCEGGPAAPARCQAASGMLSADSCRERAPSPTLTCANLLLRRVSEVLHRLHLHRNGGLRHKGVARHRARVDWWECSVVRRRCTLHRLQHG